MHSEIQPDQLRDMFENCDPHFLQQVRESAGMDQIMLARIACLSVSQIKQLETGG
jgi:DNA-binding XRE family transcriptional regulator